MPIPKTEYHPFYQTYINKVDANKSITENLQASLNRFFCFRRNNRKPSKLPLRKWQMEYKRVSTTYH